MEKLRDDLKARGVGLQGKSRTESQLLIAVSTTANIMNQLGVSYDVAVKTTAAALIASPATIRAAYEDYKQNGVTHPHGNALRGRGNKHHHLHFAGGPDLASELLIHKLIFDQQNSGISINAATIRAELTQQLQVDVHVNTVRRWLHALGYQWKEKRYIGGMKPQARKIRMRQFILEYAAALDREEAGDAVVVYMDESYIHTHTATKYGWFNNENRDVIGDGDGKRLILVHAMTDTRLLRVPDTSSTNWMSEVALTAEVVFEEVLADGEDEGDYHKTMTGDKFVGWIHNRLIPTFDALYPGKKMYLVLDNASYHKVRGPNWVSAVKSQGKQELASQLLELGVERITTVDAKKREHVWESHQFFLTPGPTIEDLIDATEKWLEAHPGHNKTIVEQLMLDKGHSLVYTPPFTPKVQPIELLWAKVKREVAKQSTHNRSIDDARQQTEEAFERINSCFCNSIVAHCHDCIDTFIKSEDSADLQQCKTLSGVIKSIELFKIKDESTPPENNGRMKMEIDPPAAAAPAPAASAARTTRKLRRRH